MRTWQNNLETVGAELFLRYRKRLMAPGIAMEIHREYRGLSIVDVLIRVHAGRQIVLDGDDFRALEAIRSGRWQRFRLEREYKSLAVEGRRDRFSRLLVMLGGALFAGFCLLSLLAFISGGSGEVLAIGLGLAAVFVGWRNRLRLAWRGGRVNSRCVAAGSGMRSHHDTAPSI